ncbi:MAG: hypothetical protein U0270_02185 [Labilithrix sp.]
MIRLWSALALVIGLASCLDPVQSAKKDALGDEVSGVSEGPEHRPGQPCLVCHEGGIGSPPEFAVAGTVFRDSASRVGLSDVTVRLQDANGVTHTEVTNRVGNFYVRPETFSPAYPMRVSLAYQGATVEMRTNIGRDGACATCHTGPRGARSPGHVYVFDASNGGEP